LLFTEANVHVEAFTDSMKKVQKVKTY